MRGYQVTACVMAAMVLAAGLPFPAEASENYELRKRVIRLTGIMSTTGDNIEVTRGGICPDQQKMKIYIE